jgi:hypothetical protein
MNGSDSVGLPMTSATQPAATIKVKKNAAATHKYLKIGEPVTAVNP